MDEKLTYIGEWLRNYPTARWRIQNSEVWGKFEASLSIPAVSLAYHKTFASLQECTNYTYEQMRLIDAKQANDTNH